MRKTQLTAKKLYFSVEQTENEVEGEKSNEIVTNASHVFRIHIFDLFALFFSFS